MSDSTQSKVSQTLRFVSLGITIALFVLVLIPVGDGLASPGESRLFEVTTIPSFSKVFLPSTIGPGSVSTLQFSIENAGATPVTDLAFVDTLPAGVTIAYPANASTDCVDGTLAAPDGGGTITFSGGRLGGGSACIITVDVTSSTPGTHQNVSGDLTSSEGNSGTASADLTVATDRPGFSKIFAPSTIPFGSRSTLTFTIDNTLNSGVASNLLFMDILPTGMVIADPANITNTCIAGVYTGGVVTAEPGTSIINLSSGGGVAIGAVNEGATCTISVDVVAASTANNVSGELTSYSPFPTLVSSGKASARLNVTVDDLQLTKTFADDPIPPGSLATLEFTINNRDRSESATNITFTDDLNTTLAGLAATGLPQSDVCGAGSTLSGTSLLTLTGGYLPLEDSCTFSVTLQVPAGAVPGAYPNTTSSITGDVDGSPIAGSPASDILFVKPAPVLTKEFLDADTLIPDPVVGAGDDVILQFTITNTSQISPTTDIAFDDNLSAVTTGLAPTLLPDGFCGAGSSMTTYVSIDALFLSVTGASLAPGASCNFDVTVTVPVGTPAGIYTNTTEDITAMVDGETVIGRPATDDFIVVAAPALNKEFTDDPVVPGGTATLEFTLSYDELAPGDVTSITFSDDLNATLAGLVATGLPVDDVCGTGSQLSGTSTLSFTGGSMAPGETCTFSVTLQVPAGAAAGSYPNTTSNVVATILGATATENPASDDLRIAGLIFTKEFLGDPVIPGDLITLRFTLENINPTDDATGIVFTDNLVDVLSGLTAVGLPANDICGPGSQITGTNFLIFTGGNLSAITSCTFSVTLQVPAGAADGTYNNVTSNLSAMIGGNSVILNPAVDELAVQSDWLLLDKRFLDDPVRPGDTVTLEFTITNTHGSDAATAITFTDDLDAMLFGLVAVDLPADPCGAGSQITGTSLLTLTGGNLAPGASCTFSVTLQVPIDVPVGDYPNTTSQITGTLNGLGVDGIPATDDLRIDYLSLSKSFDSSVLAGNTVTLTFTIENLDDATGANDLAFSDDLDAVIPGLVATGLPMSDVCGAGSQVAGTSFLTLTGGNLPPGGPCSFDIVLQVPINATSGTFPNTTSDLFSNGLPVGAPATASLTIDPTPIVSIDDVFVDEGAGTAAFTVSLDVISNWDVTVSYATMDDTALDGLDYTADMGTIMIPAGNLTTTLNIPILEDALDETSETFTVTLSSPMNATIADGDGLGTIIDNDAPPTLSISDVAVDEDSGTANITVTQSSVSGLDVTIDYETSDGSAQVGLDYEAVSGTLAIPTGETSGTFEVMILEDSSYESDETVIIGLSDPVNASLSGSSAILTILDNDYGLFLPIVFNNHIGDLVIYENDFEVGAGDEWSDEIIDIAPNGESFLGQFATDAITLTLTDLPEHNQVRVSFDLYIIRSWDGNNQNYGPDIWELTLDGNLILRTTFSNWDADNQAYPGSYPGGDYPARTGTVANNTLGYFWQGYPQDATYRLTFVIDHTNTDLHAVFSSGLFTLGDESWGLDNVEIVMLP